MNQALKKLLQSLGSKLIDYGVLCTLLLIVSFKACKQEDAIKNYVAEKQVLEQKLKDDSSNLVYTKAANGALLVRAEMAEASTSEVIEEFFKLEDINKRFGTKIKNLETAIQSRSRDSVIIYQDTGSTVIRYLPDSSAFSLTGIFNNPWYMAKATVSSDVHKLPGSLSLVVMDTTLITIDKSRVGNIFTRRDQYNVSILHANPYVKELGIKSITVPTPKPKKWGIGIQGGYTIIPIPQPYIGIGVTRTFIRF